MGDIDRRFAGNTTLGVLAFATLVFVVFPAPVPILALGVVTGSLSALVALGLVLIWRANRIVNFAQGDLGGLAAVFAASLIVGPGVPYLWAALAGLAVAIGLGALTEIFVIRRFAHAPRLILTVVTIGLAQLFAVGQLALPQLFDYDTAPQPPTPFEFELDWFPVTFTGGHLLILLVVPLTGLGLSMFLRRSRVGIAIRAAAESSTRAALLGIPVERLNTLVWVLAAALSGLGVLLRMPIQGVAIGAVLGPSLLLRALAAAVIGRMESLPRTFGAAIAIGVISEAVFFETNRTIVVDGLLFAVILVALLVQRGGADRATDSGITTWGDVREIRPVPRELMAVPVVRWGLVAIATLAAGALVLVPMTWSASRVNLFGVGLIMAMAITSLVLLTGWAGQISLGQLAVMGIGAAVAGTLTQHGHDFFVVLGAAALCGAVVSVLVGIPALRIRGPFLAVTTLAFALATGSFLLNEDYVPALVPDDTVRIVRPVLFDKFDLESEHAFYLVTLVALAFTLAVVWRVRNSRTGRVLVAVRDNRRAAQSYGIDPNLAQLTAFGLAGMIAGLAGGLYVFHQHGLSRAILAPEEGIKLFSMGVIGGLASVPGALIGAAYLTWVDYSSFTREPMARLLASGIGVLVILRFLPNGLGAVVYDVRDRVLRRVAAWQGIEVPSLVADRRVDDEGTSASTRPPTTDPPADALLVTRGVEVSYGRTQVLFGVDLHVRRGEILALLGTNGAGKSTLLAAVAGTVESQSGSITLDGREVRGTRPQDLVRDGVVLMPGGKGVFPTLSVRENLDLAGWAFDDEPERLATDRAEVEALFPRLVERMDQRAGNLSGGEQQMLALSQAFIARPRLLMIDELSLGLAPLVVEQLLGIVRRLHERGTTIVLVEQSVNVAVTVADRAVFMEKGEVRFDGPTSELLDRPEILRSVFLQGASQTSPDGGDEQSPAAADRRRFVAHCPTCGHDHRDLLELRGASARFGGVRAVDGVDLTVREGEVVGIIGANGAGKTTLFDLISGFVPLAGGAIVLDGHDVSHEPPQQRAIAGLGRSFQDARLFPAMTVRQAIATALERHVPVGDPVSAAVLSPAVKISERWVTDEVDRLIELLRLEAFADKFVGELSTGSRRIVDLACTLAHRPSVLLLDEPSSGVAQRETEALGPVLLDIRDRTGAALLVIEHDMPLITGISDRLVYMELGRKLVEGEAADVIADDRVAAGYLGGDASVIRRSGASTASGGAAPDRTRRRLTAAGGPRRGAR